MNADVFEPTMRTHMRRKPFQNFVVELEDGRQLLVDVPHAAGFDGGSASYIDADGEIHFFSYDEVRDIRLEKLQQEVMP
jgi:hypothetical protein